MNTAFDLCAAAALLVGLFFFVVGAVGIIRMPDAYHRLHAATKSSTLGLMGLLLAATLHLGVSELGVKALAVMLFLFVANPIGSHLLAKAALKAQTPLWAGTLSDEHHEDSASE
ncbi:MAG: monovalent cation/H(+) antiporter subunit G [Algisphaera sp.]